MHKHFNVLNTFGYVLRASEKLFVRRRFFRADRPDFLLDRDCVVISNEPFIEGWYDLPYARLIRRTSPGRRFSLEIHLNRDRIIVSYWMNSSKL
jgi:hypothetical protein